MSKINLLKKSVSFFVASVSIFHLFAQETVDTQSVHFFREGLWVKSPSHYGREALYTDELAYRLYTNSLKTPAEGDIFTNDEKGQSLSWYQVRADSSKNLFGKGDDRSGFERSNYMYLTYTSGKERLALLNIKGNSGVFFNGVLHAGDPYRSGWLNIPVKLKKGLNELYVRGRAISANLSFPSKYVFLHTDDATLPYIVEGSDNSNLIGGVVLINTTAKELKGLKIKSRIAGKEKIRDVPSIFPMSSRKIIFHFDGSDIASNGEYDCTLSIWYETILLDEKKVSIRAVVPTDQYINTFVSDIDGSLQYYAVTPQKPFKPGSALFLSVHGAGVEAIGQAKAYHSKDWGTLVAATNRRPRGFNWEDWGRLDALEVLDIAKAKFQPDPRLIYLTGHSMGGHGTWFLGATYPDKWAAIGACAGYPTLKGYGSADGLIPDTGSSTMEKMLLRAGNQSDVIKLANNYKPLGIYILHGDSDMVVSVNYARQMKKVLSDFHPDFSYYEYPGGGHWFGDQSVDWNPLFEYLKWHSRKPDSLVNSINFLTANPGISSSYYWASIQQQQHPLQYSHLILNRNTTRDTITGKTTNIRLLKLDLKELDANTSVKILLDSLNEISYTTKSAHDSIYLLKENNKWQIAAAPSPDQKGPQRYGTFKDAFRNRMIFIYSTRGTKEENEWSYNKARYDAETWYYRGNGAVDIVADKEFSLEKYKDRGVILFGNKSTNAAWSSLLQDCPIKVERSGITAGSRIYTGDDLSAYFVWPIRNSQVASVGVISGSGIKGMNAANANQYFAGASGFPDFMIFGLDMLRTGTQKIKMAGFFDNDWKLDKDNLVESNK